MHEPPRNFLPADFRRNAESILRFLLLLALGSGLDGSVLGQDGIPIERRFRPLSTENPAKRGRDVVVADCVALLNAYPTAPGRAEIMLRIARLYDLSNPAAGFTANRPQAIQWYREAHQSSSAGNPVWVESGLSLAQRLREHPDETSNVRDARAVLEALSAQVPAGTYEALRVAAEEVYQALAEREFALAEAACQQLMEIPVEAISAPDGQIPVQMVRANAARELVISLAQNGDVSATERHEKIRNFSDRNAKVTGLDVSSATAQKIVDQWKSGEVSDPKKPNPEPAVVHRSIFLWANAIFIVAVLAMVLVKRARRHAS